MFRNRCLIATCVTGQVPTADHFGRNAFRGVLLTPIIVGASSRMTRSRESMEHPGFLYDSSTTKGPLTLNQRTFCCQ